MNYFVLAQIFGVLGMIANVLSMQMKKRKNILIMLLLLSLFSALNFLCLGSITGAFISLFGIVEMIINYIFEKNKKDVPIYVIVIYIIINIILGLLTYKGLIDILPIVSSIAYVLGILNKKESNIRKLMLINQASWLTYDINQKAYAFAISNVLSIISNIIAMYRYDYKRSKK